MEARIAEAKAAGLAVAYPTADFLIAKRFCQYGRDDVANDRLSRAEEVVGEVAVLLEGELQRAGVAFGLPLVTDKGHLPYGVEWRSALLEGQPLVNMINFTRNPITVRLPSGECQDLIARQPLPREITLHPNTPVLAQGATRSSSPR